MNARFVRLAEAERPSVRLLVDGEPIEALQGDTLMGACQDCWVWTRSGERLRACSNEVREGLDILTTQPEAIWPLRG